MYYVPDVGIVPDARDITRKKKRKTSSFMELTCPLSRQKIDAKQTKIHYNVR